MSRIAMYLLIVIVYFGLMRVFSYSDIEFVNGTNKVAVGSKNLQFRANLLLDNTKVNWYLEINGQWSTIVRINTSSNKQQCDVLYNSTTLKSSSCEWSELYYTAVITLAPIPANVTAILYEYDNFQQKTSYLSSTYCPNLDEGPHLSVITNKNAVYNQQARFSCSKGEPYDGSSINPDYYRTCQFDATWSGEMSQCWIAPNASITTPDKLISQQHVSFSCEVTEGYPESFNITFNLTSNIVSKYNVGINHNVLLPVVLTPDMNGAALVCKVRDAYKETIVKKTLIILYGPISNNRVLYAEATYGRPLNVSLTFTANPAINGTTTNLTKIDVNTTIVNATYQIRSLGGVNHVFEWKIGNFTNEYEGNYTFTAWCVSAPEVLVKSFALKVGSSSTTLPPTISTTTTNVSVTNGGISTEALIGIAVGGSVLLIAVVIVVFVVFKRKNKPGTIPQKPTQTINVQETPIYQNQLTDSPGIEPKYVEISREQKELHEDPMPTYANTKHVTYENVKRNLR